VIFQLEIEPKNSELELTGIRKPSVGTADFNQWADEIFKKLNTFSELFILIIAHNKSLSLGKGSHNKRINHTGRSLAVFRDSLSGFESFKARWLSTPSP